jgi:hypothetical protein
MTRTYSAIRPIAVTLVTMMTFEPQALNLEASQVDGPQPEASGHDEAVERALTVLYASGLVQHEAPELDRVVVQRMLSAALEAWAEGPGASDAARRSPERD